MNTYNNSYEAKSTFRNTRHLGSEKYSFVSTGEIVDTILKDGVFEVTKYSESRVRDEDKLGTQYHSVRLAPRELIYNSWKVGEVRPEIVLGNSYNALRSFSLNIGAYRKVCSNGLCVPDGVISGFSSRHLNFDFEGLRNFLSIIPEKFEALNSSIKLLQDRPLDNEEQIYVSTQGHLIRKGLTIEKIESLPDKERLDAIQDLNFQVPRLLRPRRYSDTGTDAWSVFNRVQENLIKGGYGRRRVTSVKADNEINQALWNTVNQLATA